jgi:hypothetical protein
VHSSIAVVRIGGWPVRTTARTATRVGGQPMNVIELLRKANGIRRGDAIEPSPATAGREHVRRFMESSEQLARKALDDG